MAVLAESALRYSLSIPLRYRAFTSPACDVAAQNKLILTCYFPKMTRMMDILEDFMTYRRIKYCRLDGSMDTAQRQEEIERFKSDVREGVGVRRV